MNMSIAIASHNEGDNLWRTVRSCLETTGGLNPEIVVVDDASTDGTGILARQHGARVIAVSFRRIAATRNAGAREATGELLFFVDADTVVPVRAFRAAIRALRRGIV